MVTIDTTQEPWKSPRVDPFIITLDEQASANARFLLEQGIDVRSWVMMLINDRAFSIRDREFIQAEMNALSLNREYLAEIKEIERDFGPNAD